jgi:hypothetical protein
MKISYLLCIAIVASGFIKCQAQVSNNNTASDALLNNAVMTLEANKPTAVPLLGLGNKANLELYDRQINAIYIIGKAKASWTAKYLIPYLDYPARNYDGGSGHFGPPVPEDINKTRSYWPAFSALLDIPNSSEALVSYTLNKENPFDFRAACMSALRYINKQQCEDVADSLLSETSISETQKKFIKASENGILPFKGASFFLTPPFTIKLE